MVNFPEVRDTEDLEVEEQVKILEQMIRQELQNGVPGTRAEEAYAIAFTCKAAELRWFLGSTSWYSKAKMEVETCWKVEDVKKNWVPPCQIEKKVLKMTCVETLIWLDARNYELVLIEGIYIVQHIYRTKQWRKFPKIRNLQEEGVEFRWFECHLISDSIVFLRMNLFEISPTWDSSVVVVNSFEIQLIWDSTDLRFNWFEIQLIWDSRWFKWFNCFEAQLIWGSSALRFNCQLIWESSDLRDKWFESQVICGSTALRFNWFEVQVVWLIQFIWVIWDSNGLAVNWFQIQLDSFPIDLRFKWCVTQSDLRFRCTAWCKLWRPLGQPILRTTSLFGAKFSSRETTKLWKDNIFCNSYAPNALMSRTCAVKHFCCQTSMHLTPTGNAQYSRFSLTTRKGQFFGNKLAYGTQLPCKEVCDARSTKKISKRNLVANMVFHYPHSWGHRKTTGSICPFPDIVALLSWHVWAWSKGRQACCLG